MKAACWYGKHDIRVKDVPEPKILNPQDAVIRVDSTAICGSDLHTYNGKVPMMQNGDILGHEFMGEVMETGPAVTKVKPGDRVVVPFAISCGRCFFCERSLFSLCDNSNPKSYIAQKMMGDSPAGLFGYSHMVGGYAGGQAEYVRVPYANTNPYKIPSHINDDQATMLADVFPTGFMAAENCDIQPGDTVAVWGCGPVGQFAIRSAFLLGAEQVIAMDYSEGRLSLAAQVGATTIALDDETDIVAHLKEITGGMGPDSCIDAVGFEAHGEGLDGAYDDIKTGLKMVTDRFYVVRQTIMACRKGGTISIPGVYLGYGDKYPLGAQMNKALTIRTGQTHVHKYLPQLVKYIEEGAIDPAEIISHRLPLREAPTGYKTFFTNRDECFKVVLKPAA